MLVVSNDEVLHWFAVSQSLIVLWFQSPWNSKLINIWGMAWPFMAQPLTIQVMGIARVGLGENSLKFAASHDTVLGDTSLVPGQI